MALVFFDQYSSARFNGKLELIQCEEYLIGSDTILDKEGKRYMYFRDISVFREGFFICTGCEAQQHSVVHTELSLRLYHDPETGFKLAICKDCFEIRDAIWNKNISIAHKNIVAYTGSWDSLEPYKSSYSEALDELYTKYRIIEKQLEILTNGMVEHGTDG